jgi:hypothetical protein
MLRQPRSVTGLETIVVEHDSCWTMLHLSFLHCLSSVAKCITCMSWFWRGQWAQGRRIRATGRGGGLARWWGWGTVVLGRASNAAVVAQCCIWFFYIVYHRWQNALHVCLETDFDVDSTMRQYIFCFCVPFGVALSKKSNHDFVSKWST